MHITPEIVSISNEIRALIQKKTETISDGEGVAMLLLWGFFCDHARTMDMNLLDLARDQLEAFIEFQKDVVTFELDPLFIEPLKT
ncbi:MAG: hypothetical protein V4440_06125 [Pseudomonadota bacterium]